MHIPDGYLSPSTCAVLYAASAPCWITALRRTRRRLLARSLPQLALFAAFSFVIMMFNLPLPGGTTGHAVGVGIAAIVLGPWSSLLAISLALTIQALFFGDGGITTLGANCFNMAIAGSFAAWVLYRLISLGAAPESRRRVLAAALAGYGAINFSALLAAIEFGVQPMLFHDAAGAPLYAPYPLHVAIPAMMAGHLTVAGAAEAVMSAGLFGYLRRNEPVLVGLSAPPAESARPLRAPLWGVLALAMLLTPLGILAGGTAWGEWSAADFSDSSARTQMVAASGHMAAPSAAPTGLAHLTNLWTAPMPDYAPRFVKSAAFGYLLSAIFGVGLICAVVWVIFWIAGRFGAGDDGVPVASSTGRRLRAGVVSRTLRGFSRALERTLVQEDTARARGLLQAVDPRVKLIGLLGLVVTAALSHRLAVLAGLLALGVALAVASRLSLLRLVTRVWLVAFSFTALIAAPALFLTPGAPLAHFAGLTITANGAHSALLLLARVEAAVTLGTLLVLTTPWMHLLKALRTLFVPVEVIALLAMTHRYVVLLVETSNAMFESRQSRMVGRLSPRQERRLMIETGGVLMSKTLALGNEVFLAMRARGFRGEVRLIEEFRLRPSDAVAGVGFAAAIVLALSAGR
ncbi:MAG: cobalt transporter CbiM [Acidobacteriota bacterium]|nr:cobalt transporter CbiM [Acidobacteriota bacterium]